MAIPQLDRLKTALMTSGLSQKDNATFQVISQLIDYLRQTANQLQEDISTSGGSGGSPLAITGLNTDVVATGPGNVPAVIQPNVVTYAKVQQVTALRLLGNPNGAIQDVIEIPLGDNLEFIGGVLSVTITPGTGGLLHRVLSSTHFDSIPAVAQNSDMIYATPGPTISGEYYNGYLLSLLIENFQGIRAGYMSGYHGSYTPTNSMGYAPPELTYIVPVPEQTRLAYDYIDAFLLGLLIEDFTGLRVGYTFTDDPVTGNYGAYYPPALAFVAPPDPTNPAIDALWTRLPIGAEDNVLTVVDGVPTWQALPPIPAEPEYPWEDITFAAGDFTASGGTTPTWTVSAGNVKRWQKQQFPGVSGVGNNVRIALYVRDTTVGGTAPTQLRIALPFNIIGRFAQFISIQAAGASQTDVFVEYDDSVSTNTLYINRVGGAAFDTTASGTFLAFEISAVLAP